MSRNESEETAADGEKSSEKKTEGKERRELGEKMKWKNQGEGGGERERKRVAHVRVIRSGGRTGLKARRKLPPIKR